MADLQKALNTLKNLDFSKMYEGDFFLTWEKTDAEIRAVFEVAEALRALRENNVSPKIFDSGLAISMFRDNSTRTRFSFASACNLLGLAVQDFDEGKSQVAHGETVRETANMISFMADVIGIRDDMYIGKGNAYMHQVVDAVSDGYATACWRKSPRWSTCSATSTTPRRSWRIPCTSSTISAAWRT
jgi:ornithine carbamoyltransferase